MSKLDRNQKYRILQEMNYPLYQLISEAEEVNSDDEPDRSKDEQDDSQQDNTNQDDQEVPQQDDQEQQPSNVDVFLSELDGTQDKFLQFVLYDKLLDLSNKIETIRETFQVKDSNFDNTFNKKLEQYGQYIEVLNELIFSISTATVYNIVGQVELELIQLLEDYVKFHKKDNE